MTLRRRVKDLEQRLEAMETRLNTRAWELPPANDIPLEDLPEYPDYSVSCWTDDMVDAWNPHGYR